MHFWFRCYRTPNKGTLSGVIEIDGGYFGGHVKQENEKADRKDRRLTKEQTGKRQSVIVAREQGGRTLTTVVAKEGQGADFIRSVVAPGTIVHADEAASWDALHARYERAMSEPG